MASCGTATIRESFDPGSVSVVDCSFSPQTVTPGGTITVEATVRNDNDQPAVADVDILVDGTSRAVVTANVGAGESQTTTASAVSVPSQAGEFAVDVAVGTTSSTGMATRASGPGCSTCGSGSGHTADWERGW